MFPEIFSENSNCYHFGSCVPGFPFRTNLKLHIFVLPKMVKKIITAYASPEASSPGCIQLRVLKTVNLNFNTYCLIFSVSFIFLVCDQEASPSACKNTGVVLVPYHAWKCVPTAISCGVDIYEVPGCRLLVLS